MALHKGKTCQICQIIILCLPVKQFIIACHGHLQNQFPMVRLSATICSRWSNCHLQVHSQEFSVKATWNNKFYLLNIYDSQKGFSMDNIDNEDKIMS